MDFEQFLFHKKETPIGTTFELGVGAMTELAEEWRRQPCGFLKPLGDKVVVEPIEGDTVLSSGLTLPENAREKPMKGIVIATNNNDVAKPCVGNIVLYGKHSGVEIEHDGKEFLLMKETEIFAII